MAGFFFTGEEAAALTPKSIERRRALLDALGKDAYSTAPVQHWTQGAARLVNALGNTLEENQLNRVEKKNIDEWNKGILEALGMGTGGASSPMPAAAPEAAGGSASPPVASPVSRETMAPDGTPMPPIRPPAATPPAGAPSWAGAMPSVMPTGSLDQSGTMPKAPAAMAFAPGQGNTPSERELVIRTIAAETSGKSPEEAQAIANVILNRAKSRQLSPADVVLERNQFEPWNGGPGGRNDPMAINPNSPRYAQASQALQAAMSRDITGGATHFFAPAAQAALGRRPPAWAQGPGQQIGATAFYAPEGRAPGGAVSVSGDVPAPGVQEAQNLQRPAPGQFNIPGRQGATPDRTMAIIRALSNPWAQQANPMLAGVAQKVLADQMTGSQFGFQVVGDQLYRTNPKTGNVEPVGVQAAKPQWGIIGEDEFGNKRYGFVNPGTQQVVPYQQQPTQGATNNQPGIPVAPNGQPAPSIPPAPPGVNPKVWRDEQTKKLVNPDKLTEVQSKDVGFYTRGVPANEALTQLEGALTSPKDSLASKLPGGNYLVSNDFQKAQNASRDFLAVILRKDTGAAVTPAEVDTYGEIFLPKPGDRPEIIQQKRESRARALEGIRLGLGTAKEVVDFAKPKPQAAPQKQADNSGVIQQARDAIAKGADPAKVRARLKENGINPGSL